MMSYSLLIYAQQVYESSWIINTSDNWTLINPAIVSSEASQYSNFIYQANEGVFDNV